MTLIYTNMLLQSSVVYIWKMIIRLENGMVPVDAVTKRESQHTIEMNCQMIIRSSRSDEKREAECI